MLNIKSCKAYVSLTHAKKFQMIMKYNIIMILWNLHNIFNKKLKFIIAEFYISLS